MKESTPILFQLKDMIEDIILEQNGVDDLHLRSQECPPLSGRVPDKSPDPSSSILEITVNMV